MPSLLHGVLNRAEMARTDILDSYLLLPCRESGKGGGGKPKKMNHSISGWFEVENSPLRIDTILFVGDPKRLKTQMKRRENIDLEKSNEKYEENFKGVSGLTFPIERGDGSSMVAIWMPKFDWSILDIETLSHECLHAAVMVMRMSGVRSKIFTASKEIDVDDEGLCYRQATMLTGLLKKMVGKQNRLFRKDIEGR